VSEGSNEIPVISRRVLVVDEDLDTLELMRDFLSDEGYVVDAAPTGEKALDLIEKIRHDIIVLDLWMPIINGQDLLKAVDRNGNRPKFVIIAPSKASSGGANLIAAARFLEKPFDLVDLLEAIKDR
jgi:DNA-binding response OmpR family regulator